MFNVKEVIREIEAETNPESEGIPHAKGAKGAKDGLKVSTISTISTPAASGDENIGKLESLRFIYDGPEQDALEKDTELDSIPYTDHELAEHKINGLALRDDRAFVRQMLLGAYGSDRLELVDQYFNEWSKGVDSEPIELKKENAGRRRANIWLRGKL